MSIITNIKEFFAKIALKKIDSNLKQIRKFYNFDEIKNIHIIAGLENVDDQTAEKFYNDLYLIFESLKAKSKNAVFSIFVNNALFEQKRFYINAFELKNCSKLNFKPSDEICNITDKFDVIINLTPHICYPIEYLAALSDAKFKIAVHPKIDSVKYDFIMKMNSPTAGAKEIFDSIVFYLEKIKSK